MNTDLKCCGESTGRLYAVVSGRAVSWHAVGGSVVVRWCGGVVKMLCGVETRGKGRKRGCCAVRAVVPDCCVCWRRCEGSYYSFIAVYCSY